MDLTLSRMVWKEHRLARRDCFRSAKLSNRRLGVALRRSFFRNRSIRYCPSSLPVMAIRLHECNFASR